ncbi:hypothetical protein HDU89_000971 [Geranomyces variabilis]|nr:hypothetical protein HDU89_000971 [Geranomyces variabilis]
MRRALTLLDGQGPPHSNNFNSRVDTRLILTIRAALLSNAAMSRVSESSASASEKSKQTQSLEKVLFNTNAILDQYSVTKDSKGHAAHEMISIDDVDPADLGPDSVISAPRPTADRVMSAYRSGQDIGGRMRETAEELVGVLEDIRDWDKLQMVEDMRRKGNLCWVTGIRRVDVLNAGFPIYGSLKIQRESRYNASDAYPTLHWLNYAKEAHPAYFTIRAVLRAPVWRGLSVTRQHQQFPMVVPSRYTGVIATVRLHRRAFRFAQFQCDDENGKAELPHPDPAVAAAIVAAVVLKPIRREQRPPSRTVSRYLSACSGEADIERAAVLSRGATVSTFVGQ